MTRFGHIFFFLWINLLMSFATKAQNLVPNPSFETYTQCPPSNGNFMGGPMDCPPWFALSSANWFHVCGDPMYFGVPYNIWGYQYAHTGVAYAGGYFHEPHEYVQAPLLQTLEAGVCYKVGCWMNLSNESCGADHVGILLSDSPGYFPAGSIPQVDWQGEFFSDTVNWFFVWDFITAVGNESYINIGNFYTTFQTEFDPSCTNPIPFAYYYIDDVIVEEVPSIPFDLFLDASGSGCDSFLIEPTLVPPLEDALFEWSTGSHDQSITVYESGEYEVTVTYGCVEAEAIIQIDLYNPPNPDLGPDAIVCEGESFDISLDPDAGDYEWNDGSTDSEFTIDAPGIYQVTLDDGCEISSDTIVIAYLSPPAPFSLGPDTFLCPGDMITYQFDPSLGEFEWQDQDNSPTYTIDDDGSYSLTISNMCGESSDEVDIININPPVVILGPDSLTMCAGDDFDIELDETMGDFLWQDGSVLPYYHIINPGYYGLTVTNECGVDVGEIYVSQVPEPNVMLGPAIDACEGDTIHLNAGNTIGVYTWQDGSTNSTFEVTQDGVYSVSVSNLCGSDVGSVQVVYYPIPIPPDLGPDFSICPGDQVVLHVNTTGATAIWNDMSTADSLIVTTQGVYYVNVSGFCGTFSDTVDVVVNSLPPQLSLPVDFILCQGQSTMLDAGISGVNYLWSNGSVLPQLNVTSPGTYALTVSNACGMDIDSVEILDGGFPPTVFLPQDTAICPGSSFVLTPLTTGVSTWLWQNGSSGVNYTVNSTGEISIEVQNQCGSAFDTMQITALPGIPSLDLGPDTAICSGGIVLLSIALSDVGILWSNGSTNNEISVATASTIYATITNTCGTSSDTVAITALPDIPPLDLGPDITICPGAIILLSPGISNVTYAWQNGSTNPQFDVMTGGVVSLTISNICGEETDSLLVTESFEGPQVDLGPDLLACQGEVITVKADVSGVEYEWQDGSTQDEITIDHSDTLILTVTNLCGTDKDTVYVEISGEPPLAQLGPDTSVCEGILLKLVSNADSITTSTWQDGTTGKEFEVNAPGLYTLYQSNRCGESIDSILVSYQNAPEPFDLGPDTLLCPGESVMLNAPFSNYAIEWQDGSTLMSILADKAQTYILHLRNECGESTDSIRVRYDTDQPILVLEDQIPWCKGDTILLDVSQSFNVSYAWNTGASTSSILVIGPGLYSVEVFAHCADGEDQVEVYAMQDCPEGEFYVPNVISPNGDGINDVFSLFHNEKVTGLIGECSVFDRWGNMVYHSTEIPFLWNGKFKDEILQPAVFAYIMQIEFEVAGEHFERSFVGDVTIIR